MQKAVLLWGGVLALGLSAAAWAGPTAQGAPFHVSSCTTCIQQVPAVAGSASGAFLTVWKGASPVDSNGVSGRMFSGTGTPMGSDFLANKDLVQDQYDPAVARDGQGSFIVVWSEVVNGNSEIKGRRYGPTGAALGAPSRSTRTRPGRRPSPPTSTPRWRP